MGGGKKFLAKKKLVSIDSELSETYRNHADKNLIFLKKFVFFAKSVLSLLSPRIGGGGGPFLKNSLS